MKSILISIKPQWVAKILNKEKTIEVRKRFPKDYVGWVYIYCTKGGDMICYRPNFDGYACVPNLYGNEHFNGKVVARFWCDKVEQVLWLNPRGDEHIPYLKSCDLLKCACLCQDEFEEYVGDSESYAIHIGNLEIFDKPKELNEFGKWNNLRYPYVLTRAPQSWCYVEYGQD